MTSKGGDAAPDAETGRLVSPNFITDIIERDLEAGRHARVVTRFPPEPNGYAHVGHAFASFLDFGLAHDYGGACRLRFDDTNPEVEEMRFVRSIEEDMRWLGWHWEGPVRFASDYFEQLYQLAERLVSMGDAYVDSLPTEEIQRMRGTVETPGTPSPYRERSPEENLDLFRRMRAGEFPNGAHVLRARIDLASANMKLRDPLLYRIVHAEHYRTGATWCIYPFYDFQHPLSDAIEGVTHSLCSLEFVDNRELYDWLVDRLFPGRERPRQYEFGRRNLEYTVVSKRRLIRLVEGGHVEGWDDPRMPTIAGLRRRGVRPAAIRDFASRIGVSRTNRTVDMALLEHSIRDDLNASAPRVMAVTDPLPVTLTNVDAGETLDAPYWPPDVPREGSRAVPFGPKLVIERSDFAEDPPRGFRRLSPGRAVRLRHAYVVRCDEIVKGPDGDVRELRCSVLPGSLGRNPEGVKVGGAIHWLSAADALTAEFRLYDRLFSAAEPGAGGEDFLGGLNPDSLVVRRGLIEPSVAGDPPDTRYQFERLGYFWRDPQTTEDPAADTAAGTAHAPLVFNRIVTLKDSWARRSAAESAGEAEASRADASRADAPPAANAPTGAAGERRGRDGPPDVWRTATGSEGEEPPEAPDTTAGFDAHQRGLYQHFLDDLGLSPEDAAQIAARDDLSGFFEATVAEHGDAAQVANWVVNDLVRELKDRELKDLGITPERLAHLIRLVDDGTVTLPVARELFGEVVASGTDPEMLVRERGLERLADEDALREIIARVLAEHPAEVASFRGGKQGLKGFFVGQVMRATQGRADPQLVQRLVGEALAGA